MALYGPSSIARVLPEHGRDAGFLKSKGVVGALLSPPAWTKAYTWMPAMSCFEDARGYRREDGKGLAVFCRQHQERSNFMGSLRMSRSGAIHQGVFTSGSLTEDGRARVDAFVDRWHCRRSAQRSGRILAAVLEHLEQSVRARLLAAYLNRWRRNLDPLPRLLLRPKLSLLLDTRRRHTLHKFLTAWGLLTRHLLTDRRTARRQGIRILRLLSRREGRLKAAGMERWKDAARAERALDRRKAASFERWRLFVLLCRHDSCWGVERAMGILRRAWVKRLAFDRLTNWRTARMAARVVRDTLATALLHQAWVSWRNAVEQNSRQRKIREAWSRLLANTENAGRKNSVASAHCRAHLLRKNLLLWLETSKQERSLREAFKRWARHVAQAKREKDAAAALLLRLCNARAFELLRRALRRWKDDVVEEEADDVVSLPPQMPASLSPRPGSICRCVRCLRRYGHLGARANKPRSRATRSIVVTESRCDVNGHLELQLRSARRTLDKALRRAGAHAPHSRGGV